MMRLPTNVVPALAPFLRVPLAPPVPVQCADLAVLFAPLAGMELIRRLDTQWHWRSQWHDGARAGLVLVGCLIPLRHSGECLLLYTWPPEMGWLQ